MKGELVVEIAIDGAGAQDRTKPQRENPCEAQEGHAISSAASGALE
jgi:hypothetical protein